MTLAEACAAVMFVGITLYALLAGADFGAGFWDLVAGDARRGRAPRALIEQSIGPVWEANHVWLIFVLVMLWTAFPTAFAPIMSTLYVPLTLAAIGIILRGASFAFRKGAEAAEAVGARAPGPERPAERTSIDTMDLQRLFGATFASSSVLTPFMLGAVVGGVASGRVPAGPSVGNVMRSWLNPTSFLGGAMAVIVCSFLAAVYLTADAERRHRPELVAYFRTRALGSGVVAGVIALAGVFVLRDDAPRLYHGLTHRGAPLIVLSAVAGLSTLVLLSRALYQVARYTAALAVVAVLWGWAAGQYPFMLENTLRISDAAGAHATLVSVLVVLGVGSLLLVPSLAWLLALTQRGILADEH